LRCTETQSGRDRADPVAYGADTLAAIDVADELGFVVSADSGTVDGMFTLWQFAGPTPPVQTPADGAPDLPTFPEAPGTVGSVSGGGMVVGIGWADAAASNASAIASAAVSRVASSFAEIRYMRLPSGCPNSTTETVVFGTISSDVPIR